MFLSTKKVLIKPILKNFVIILIHILDFWEKIIFNLFFLILLQDCFKIFSFLSIERKETSIDRQNI
jgi:hypothetical protein